MSYHRQVFRTSAGLLSATLVLGGCSSGKIGGIASSEEGASTDDHDGQSSGGDSGGESENASDPSTGGESEDAGDPSTSDEPSDSDEARLPRVESTACATPVQEAVDTSGWREIFVGTSANGCSDSAALAGSASTPYCNPHLALSKVTTASTIVTFYDGQYRLADFDRVGGGKGGLGLPNKVSTATSFLIYRAAAGAKPVFLGSVRRQGGWTQYSAAPRIFRLSVEDLASDVYGLWQVQDGLDRTYTKARRFRHVMVSSAGVRVHAAVANLADGGAGTPETSMTESDATRDATWTKADAAGVACGASNQGCYVYLRLDDTTVDPDTLAFEISQLSILGGGSPYMVIDGLHGRFSEEAAAFFAGIDNTLVQNCSFATSPTATRTPTSLACGSPTAASFATTASSIRHTGEAPPTVGA